MKKTTLILIILSVVSFLAIIIFSFLPQQKEKNGKESADTAPSPSLPTYIEGNIPIENSIEEKDYNVPKELPLYTFGLEGLSQESSFSLAKKLGFQSPAQIFTDINEGEKFFWSEENRSLVITPKTGLIKLFSSEPSIPEVADKNLSATSIVDVAINELEKAGLSDFIDKESFSITPMKQSANAERMEDTSKDTAELFRVAFSPKGIKHATLTINPEESVATVGVLPDGSIYNLEIYVIKNVAEKPESSHKTKTYEEYLEKINQAKIVSFLSGYINLKDVASEDIEKITVENMKVVYLFEGFGKKEMSPVLLLEGSVKFRNGGENRALLYLPAYK